MWDMTIEKLENHKYRLFVKWDGTEEMLNGLLEDGFSVFDDNNTYYSDYEDDCTLFDFGMSMCECYQKLSSNRLFNIDYMLHFSRQPVDAELLKDVEERIPTYSIIKAMIDNWGMEPFLYLLAKNYDSLIDEATQRYHDSDEASFMSWLKESIDPRFTTQVSSDIYSRYLILNNAKLNLSDLFCGYWYAWQIVRDNWEEFKNWINRVEYADDLDFQFYDSIFNQEDTIQKQFNIVYFYGYGKLARILFEMLNEPVVNYKVKKLIKDVLMEYAKSDSEFAGILQKMYSEYKSIAGGGIDISFETAVADENANESNEEPQTSKSPAEKTAQQTDDDSEIRDFKDTEPKEKAKILCPIIRELLETNKERVEDFLKDYDLEEVKGMIENILIADAKEYTNIQREIIDDLSGTDHKKSSRYYYKNRLWLLPFFQIIGRLFKWEVLVGKRKQKAFVKALFPEMRCDKDPEFDVVYKEEFDFIETCRNRISKGNTGQPKEWKEKYEWIDKCCK